MAKIDITYHNLLDKILQEGYTYEDPNRKGVNRLEILEYTFRHEFKDGFPAITTKKLNYKSVVTELIWFLRGDTNIKYLVDNGCNIWNKDAYNYYKKIHNDWEEKYLMSLDEFIMCIKFSKKELIEYLNKSGQGFKGDIYNLGDLGPVYGHQWVKWGNNNKKLSLVQPKPKLDPNYEPTYLGIASGKNKEGHFLSKTWEGMIARCYDKNNISYPLYGGKGVYVCNKWLSFDGFLEDVQLLDNFDKKLKEPKNYVLDKDGKGNGFVYSLETCQWITCEENANLISNIEYIVEKDGVQYTFTNISKFCKEYNIDGRNFSDLWTKNAKTRYGFKFISKRNLNEGVNQIARLITNLKEKPLATDHIVNSWNVGDLPNMALPPCHYGFQVVVRPLNKIKCDCSESQAIYCGSKCQIPQYGFELHWQQRSVDTFLGLPFNIASYATLALILEKITGYKALAIQGDLKKVHLYDNSLDAVKEQLSRDVDKYDKCELTFNSKEGNSNEILLKSIEIEGFDKCINQLYIEGFKLENYESYPGIRVEMLERDE